MVSDYHIRQYEQMYASTRGLLELIEECCGEIRNFNILDLACGGGGMFIIC